LTTPFQIITSISYSPDGSYLAVGGVTTPGGPVQWWRLADTSRPMRSDPHDLRCKGIAFSRDGRHLYSLSYSAVFRHRLDDTSTDRRHLENGIHAIAIDDVGQPCLLFDSGAVVRFDAELSRARKIVTVPRPIGLSSHLHQIATFPDRPGIVAACGSHLAVWDGPPNHTPRVIEAPDGPVLKVAVSPGAQQILTGGPDGYVRIWDVSSLQVARQYDWQIGDILSLAISPDGLTVAAGGLSRIVIWDVSE
jgi:WD40 repeat protein